MRLVKRPTLLLILSCALGLAACGGGDDERRRRPTTAPTTVHRRRRRRRRRRRPTVNPDGADNTYVVTASPCRRTPARPTRSGSTSTATARPTTRSAGCWARSPARRHSTFRARCTSRSTPGGIILLANLKATDLADATASASTSSWATARARRRARREGHRVRPAPAGRRHLRDLGRLADRCGGRSARTPAAPSPAVPAT